MNVDQKKYSTSSRYAQERVLVGITYDKVIILTDNYDVIVAHDRLYAQKSKSMDLQPYLSLMATRPTALKYTTFFNQLPLNWQSYLDECTFHEKKKVLHLLSNLLKDRDFDKGEEALSIASQRGLPSAETIQQVFPKMLQASRGMNRYFLLLLSRRRKYRMNELIRNG